MNPECLTRSLRGKRDAARIALEENAPFEIECVARLSDTLRASSSLPRRHRPAPPLPVLLSLPVYLWLIEYT
jgi:hypothetical protein